MYGYIYVHKAYALKSDCLHTQQEEILRFLFNLLTNCPCSFALGELLWEKGIPLIVLVRGQSMVVRVLAIKVSTPILV